MAKHDRLPQVQVHYIEPDGVTGVINYLTGENIEAVGNEAKLARLRDRASRLAGEWGKIFPITKFVVREV